MNYHSGINVANFAAVSCSGCNGGIGGFFGYASNPTHVVIDLVGTGSPPPASYWASIDAAGTLHRAVGVNSSSRVALGGYQIDFPRDVTNCGYNATVGTPAAGNDNGEVFVSPRAGNTNAIFVQTRDSAGVAADRAFYLSVHCL